MTAQEARAYANKGVDDATPEINKFYIDAKSYMELHAHTYNPGTKIEMTYSTRFLSRSGAEYLKTQGYEVEYISDQRDGDFYKISW